MDTFFSYTFFTFFLYTFTNAKNFTCTKQDSLKDIIVTNCNIIIPDEKLRKELTNAASNEDYKLLKLALEFPENTKNVILSKHDQSYNDTQKLSTHFYTPFEWYITTSRLGQKLINLKPNYEVLSLSTLKLKTDTLSIKMLDQPVGCLKKLSLREYLFLVKELLKKYLKESKNENKAATLSNKVCTSAMRDVDGFAEFLSICYEKKHNGTCLYLMRDKWSLFLQIFIRFIKILAVLFCPLLIPKRLYQLKYREDAFVLRMKEKLSMKFKVSKVKEAIGYDKWDLCIPISHFMKCKKFKPGCLNTDVEYNLDVSEIYLGVEENRLVSSSFLPTGLFSMIVNNLYYCEIRHSNGFYLCCSSSLCPRRVQSKCCRPTLTLSWFHCCQAFMKLIVFLLLPLPWIIRIVIYHFYEKANFMNQQLAATKLGVHLSFEGYLLGYITPMHWLFLSMYVIYGIDLLLFGTFVQKVTRKIAIVIKQCVRDMHLGWTFQVFSWVVRLFLGPFTVLGVVGIFVAPFYWIFAIPFICLTLCFYYIPSVNLFFRFLVHMLWFILPDSVIRSKKTFCLDHISQQMDQLKRQINIEALYPGHKIISKESRSKSCLHRYFQILLVFLCLFTLLAIAVLLTECIGYVIEVISFTLIGLILHSEFVLPFFSLGFLIIIYFIRSMNKVKHTYLNFSNMIIDETIKLVGDCDPKTSANTANFISKGHFDRFKYSKINGIFLRVYSLLLFIDSNEKPLIPSQFFYKACEMPIPHLPGSLAKNFLKAFLNFFLILLFLIFVTIVVMTFGEIYSLSSTNQMLATLAGGFLPFFIEHIIEIHSTQEEINTESLNFKNNFLKIVDDFVQRWRILDISCTLTPANENTDENADTENVIMHIEDSSDSDDSEDERNALPNYFVYFSKPEDPSTE